MKQLKMFLGVLMVLSLVPLALAQEKKNIVETAIAVNSEGPYAGQFDTLIAAVANDPVILKALSGRGKYTVFAPTDDGFAKLGLDENNIGTVPKSELRKILLYHVVRGERDAKSVLDSTRLRTMAGQFLYQEGGILTDQNAGTANIIVTDVRASNGIIHAIDSVVIPK